MDMEEAVCDGGGVRGKEKGEKARGSRDMVQVLHTSIEFKFYEPSQPSTVLEQGTLTFLPSDIPLPLIRNFSPYYHINKFKPPYTNFSLILNIISIKAIFSSIGSNLILKL